jgi:hypothetical protein
MTDSAIVQYETLQWAWNLAKEYDTCVHCREMQQFRDHIKKILDQIAESGEIDFNQLLKDLKAGNF